MHRMPVAHILSFSFLEGLPADKVQPYMARLIDMLHAREADMMARIEATGTVSEADLEAIAKYAKDLVNTVK